MRELLVLSFFVVMGASSLLGPAARAACPPGRCDVDNDGAVSIVDVQCTILAALASLEGGPPPACLPPAAPDDLGADLSCSDALSVADVQLAVACVLGLPLGSAIDGDGDQCPDACDAGPSSGSSLRFFGAGVGDIDRVKIVVDDPATNAPGPPVDVGATDFTIELFLRGTLAENTGPPIVCGANVDWIYGNIVVDRDRYNQGRKFGVSLGAGRVVFGVTGAAGADRTLCGTTNVLDGAWHHVAVQRRRADGYLWLWVDGVLQAQGDGPDGDVSYPDNGVPGNFCGGPCTQSDPFLVLAAEKHDAGPEYPSFSGWIDELRVSTTLRYTQPFSPPSAPFVPDAQTGALYRFNEGQGAMAFDTSGALQGPSHGTLKVGGTPKGPVWSNEVPFP
jgi:hypothetical protein